jgi:hypothetical protein
VKRWQKITIGSVAGFLVFVVVITAISSGKTKTVTKTVTVTTASEPVTVAKTPASCVSALKIMNRAVIQMNGAANFYATQILPAFKAGLVSGSADAIVANENRGTAKVNQATALVRRATPLVTACVAAG